MAHVKVTPRDLMLLTGLLESRVMALSHVAALYFEGRYDAAKKCLLRLKSVGMVQERPRHLYEPAILFLGRPGFRVLQDRGILANYPSLSIQQMEKRARVSPLTLKHELEVMDAKQALCLQVRKCKGLSITEFATWPRMFQFPSFNAAGPRVLIKPDAFVRIGEDEAEHIFFMELDRSTESLEVLAQRAHGYFHYYRSGGMAVRFGFRKEEFKNVPFQVMMLFRTAERRNNTAERLLLNQPPILTHSVLTTFDEFKSNPLGRIWMHPLDYRNATRGTPFEPANDRGDPVYRRNMEREQFIERAVAKHALIESTFNRG